MMASAPAVSPSTAAQRKKLTSYVGFANLPNQMHRAAVRKGFTFTAMVVGMYDRLARKLTHGQVKRGLVNRP